MGSVGEIVEVFDVDETIFVAVGENFDKCKTMLFWAVQNFSGKKICVLHVHRPPRVAASERKFVLGKFKQHAAQEIEQCQREKVTALLNSYLFLLSKAGVHADKLWIDMDNVEEGIVELIVRHNIRWLVMGAASDRYYSRKMASLKSKKALFVCEEAPICCHIWFVCKGCLIYTRNNKNRGISENGADRETASPLLLLDSNIETEQSAQLKSSYKTRRLQFPDAEEDADESERDSRGSASLWSQGSSFSISEAVVPSFTPLTDEEESDQGLVTCEIDLESEKAIIDAKKPKRKVFEEAMNRWREEDFFIDAYCKSKALESLCAKEMVRRAELEELLQKEKQGTEQMKNQIDGAMKELQMVQDQYAQLKSQLAEMQDSEKELEEKILSAVELLISFKKKRDDMRIEHGNALREAKALGKMVKVEAGSSCGRNILEFSFLEINEATNSFDPSWKIGEGQYGSVYKGLLHHVPVAIRMFPSYGLQSFLGFQDQIDIWSKVRHPNLVTLMGICSESRSLVYEYMQNCSLEDYLSFRGNTPPLSWQTRARIASEVCSALLFLHSSRPCITHGNLKPSKILLDSNFVSKISDYGVVQSISQGENKIISAHMDPKFFETGKITPESDIYSFGVILLQFLTRRPVAGVLRDVKCALENDNFNAVLDHSAGDWPVARAKELARLAVRCCEKNHLNRPGLSEICRVLKTMKASHFAPSPSFSGPREQRKAPSHFLCPIFQEVMKDPLIAADGFTYEAEAIREWLESGHDTSPMTNLKMENCNLIPNHALHQAIREWQQMW